MAKKNSMPRVLKIGKLDIRHNTPRSRDDLSWLEVTNFYWGERFLGAKVPSGYSVILPHGYVSIVTKPTGTHRFRYKGFYFHINASSTKDKRYMDRFFPLVRAFKAIRWYRRWQVALAKD